MTKKFKQYLDDRTNSIGRYIEYKAHQNNITFEEAARSSLSRIWQLVTGDDFPIAFMTAFRGENNIFINRSKNMKLEGDLKYLGYGFIPVVGGYKETIRDEDGNETDQQVDVQEESYAIFGKNTSNAEFRDHILQLIKKYQQESAIIKYQGDSKGYLLDTNGGEIPLGEWTPNSLSQFYTSMKKGPSNRKFTFEAAGDASISTRLVVDKYFEANS